MRSVRGTPLDIFGYTADRRLERRLISEYERDIKQILSDLRPESSIDKYTDACALAALPASIRGYGPVKEAAYEKAQSQRQVLLSNLSDPTQKSTTQYQEVGA